MDRDFNNDIDLDKALFAVLDKILPDDVFLAVLLYCMTSGTNLTDFIKLSIQFMFVAVNEPLDVADFLRSKELGKKETQDESL